MARITVEDCLEQVNGNRFALIHLVVERIRQHRRGAPFLAEGRNKEVVMTLREVAAGAVSFDNIEELGARQKRMPRAETPVRTGLKQEIQDELAASASGVEAQAEFARTLDDEALNPDAGDAGPNLGFHDVDAAGADDADAEQ